MILWSLEKCERTSLRLVFSVYNLPTDHGKPDQLPHSRMPPAKRPAAKAKQALTEEQKQEIREAFDLFDTDGSGALRASAPTMSCGVPPRSRARTLRAPRRTVCHSQVRSTPRS